MYLSNSFREIRRFAKPHLGFFIAMVFWELISYGFLVCHLTLLAVNEIVPAINRPHKNLKP